MELFDVKEKRTSWLEIGGVSLIVMVLVGLVYLLIMLIKQPSPVDVPGLQVELIDQRIKKFHQEMSWAELEVERMKEEGPSGVTHRERKGK